MRLVLRVAGSLTTSVLFMLMLASVALAGEPGESLAGTADATLEIGADVDLIIDTTLDSTDECGSCNDSDTTVDLGTDADLDLDADLVIDLGDGDGCGCNGKDSDTTVDLGTDADLDLDADAGNVLDVDTSNEGGADGSDLERGGTLPGTSAGSRSVNDGRPRFNAGQRFGSAATRALGPGAGSLPDTAIEGRPQPDLSGLVFVGLVATQLRRRVSIGVVR
ncbi:MAG: hypothetical protein ACR2GO_02420 [Candidatus Limnocylindria bacterium]